MNEHRLSIASYETMEVYAQFGRVWFYDSKLPEAFEITKTVQIPQWLDADEKHDCRQILAAQEEE